MVQERRGLRQLPPTVVPPPTLVEPPAEPVTEAEKLDMLIQLQRDTIAQLKKAVIVVPPDPEMLATAGQLKAELGRMFIPTWRSALSCPAGFTTPLPFNVPPGWVTYRRKPLEVSSDLYDPDIGLNVYSDGVLINPVAPMPLTGAFMIDMGEYVTQWQQLIVEVINGTAIDAVVSFQVCTYLMDSSFWEEFALPLIEAVRQRVEAIIE